MARWEEFEAEAPDVAELGGRMLMAYGIAYIGTTRRDGSARVSPLTPALVGGGLFVGLIPGTPKCRDLERDRRITLHFLPGPGDAELVVSGLARRLGRSEVAALIEGAPANVRLSHSTVICEIDIRVVNYTRFEKMDGEELPVATRSRWSWPPR